MKRRQYEEKQKSMKKSRLYNTPVRWYGHIHRIEKEDGKKSSVLVIIRKKTTATNEEKWKGQTAEMHQKCLEVKSYT